MITRRATAHHLPAGQSVVVEPLPLPVPEPIVEPVTAEIVPLPRRRITVAEIRVVAAAQFGLTVDQLVSDSRNRAIVWPRQFAMYLAQRTTGRSLKVIGHQFGRDDHTTVLHGVRETERRLLTPSRWCGAHAAICLALLDQVPA